MAVGRLSKFWLGAAGAAALVGVGLASTFVIAADHDEADTASFDDLAGDIGDLYAFHSGERMTLILTFDGYKLRFEDPTYDADVLYGFHLDTDADNVADHDVWVRFGQNGAGEWGVQVQGVPGTDGPIVGAIETVVSDAGSGAQVYAGLRDDPFFFDLEGFKDTLMTGDLAFDPTRDFVAVKNTMAVAVEFDHAALGSTNVSVWATTGRLAP